MKLLLSTCVLLGSLLILSCKKDENISTIEGQWFIRTKVEQVSTSQNTTTTLYKVYRRIDVGAKRYTTFDFTANKLFVKEYTRDTHQNKDIVISQEFEYKISNNKIVLKDNTGKELIYDFSFIGLSNRNLKLEFFEDIMDPNNGNLSKTSKVLLIREFPIDDSEGEILPPPPDFGNPTSPN